MQTQEYDEFAVVWDGRPGVYLTALNGCAPYQIRPPVMAQRTPTTSELIVDALTKIGPMTQTQLASACNRAGGDTGKSLRELESIGRVVGDQPCLFAIAPRHGQVWRLACATSSR